MKARGVALCLLAAVLFGASTPAAKLLLDGLSPLALAGLLYLGAAAAMAPLALAGPRPVLSRRSVWRMGLTAVVGGVAAPALLVLGLHLTSAASASLALALEPVATAVLAAAFFREHLGRRAWMALGLMLVASALLAGGGERGGVPGIALVALACVAWALDNNLTATIDGFTPVQITLVKGLAGGIGNLGLAALTSTLPQVVGPTLPLALAVGALSYGLSIACYVSGAQVLGATRAQLAFATAPFLGLFVSWTALGEPVLAVQLVAAALTALAVLLLLTGRHEHEHVHEPTTHVHGHRHDDGHHDHVHEGLPATTWHVHAHSHGRLVHAHAHEPDLHHRHEH